MKLLVTLDGSQLSQSVLPAAHGLSALIPNLELHLLEVIDPKHSHGSSDHDVTEPLSQASGIAGVAGGTSIVTEQSSPRMVETRGEALERARITAVERMEALAKQLLPGDEVYCTVEWDKDAVEGILRHAEAIGADAIAMASHGRSGLSHAISGSTAEGIMRKSPRPVLVIGPAAQSKA